jgi:hypothetical protein
MAKNTVGDVVSRIRIQAKGVKQDAFMTDRMIYTFVLKHAKWLMKREDSKNKLMAFSGVMQTMDYVELVEIDKVEACCTGVRSDCTIKRTKEKLPIFLQGYFGPLIRTIASIDGSEELQPVLPTIYAGISNSKNFKYNTTKYYWFIDDYIYFPNLQWEAVRIEGIFEDDISRWTCEEDSCKMRQDDTFNVPDYLLGELEAQVIKDLMGMDQIPSDTANDKQNIART